MHITREMVNQHPVSYMHIIQEANGVVLEDNFTVFLCTQELLVVEKTTHPKSYNLLCLKNDLPSY